jgi:hypothetical protein
MVYFTAECFSGECGNCQSCCGNVQEEADNHPENYKRSIDTKKLYNKRMNEITDDYWKKMIDVTRKLGYKNPEENGRIRKKIMINENAYFKLYDKDNKHDMCCHSPLCLAIYQNAHEYEKKKKYSILPIYINQETTKKQCYLCLSNNV